jgi:hypothetical protein
MCVCMHVYMYMNTHSIITQMKPLYSSVALKWITKSDIILEVCVSWNPFYIKICVIRTSRNLFRKLLLWNPVTICRTTEGVDPWGFPKGLGPVAAHGLN